MRAGLSAAAAYAVLSVSDSVAGFTANAEHFVVPPMLGGVLLLARPASELRRGHVVLAGFLLGVAVLMKQHGAVFVAFGTAYLVAAGLLRSRPRWPAAAAEVLLFALGALAPYGLTCLAMYQAGAFAAFWFWTFTYAREYVSQVPLAMGLHELRGQALHILSASIALWVLAVIGLTAPGWDLEARRPAAFLGLFTLCSFAAVWPGLRFKDHYFILFLPAASILVGMAVGALSRKAATRDPALAVALGVGLPLVAVTVSLLQEHAILFSLPPAAVARRVFGSNPFPEAVEIARYLREHSDPGERVVVVGSEPEIYFYARRHAATSYMYTYPMMEPQPFARQMQEEMIAQIERERPRFVVLVNVDTSWSRRADSSPLLFDWAVRTVDEKYLAVGLADIMPDGSTLFRWDAAARDAPPRSRFHVTIFRHRS